MISALLWAVIGGTVIGLLGKLVAPGDRDDDPALAHGAVRHRRDA